MGGSFSRSSLSRLAGARSRLSGAVAGPVVPALLLLPACSSRCSPPVSSAIVTAAVAPLLRLEPGVGPWALSRPRFAVTAVMLDETTRSVMQAPILDVQRRRRRLRGGVVAAAAEAT